MNKGINIILGIFFIMSIFIMPSFSIAESEIFTQEGDILVEMSPRNPEPYQETTISISSYSTDLNKAVITWRGASGIVLSGVGKTSYSFVTPGPNNAVVFDITIKPVGSINIVTKNITIYPSEIDLLWEPVDGYSPLFYKGKTLASKEGMVKVTAIPNSNTIKSGSGNISFTWKNNGEVISDSSGYNKNSYIFKSDVFSDRNEINLTASSVNENYSAEKTIEVPVYLPRVIFYEKSPTEGILYNNALNSESVFKGEEMTIVAEPYFLAIKDKESSFMYNWEINGAAINTPSKKKELTVRPTSRGGYANIMVTFENFNKLFQKVTGTLKLSL